jgi:ferredoxin
MPKVIQNRSICIGCGACEVLYPQYFSLSHEDGRARLKGAEQKNQVFVLKITPAEVDEFIEIAQNCPAGVIKVFDDDGNELT